MKGDREFVGTLMGFDDYVSEYRVRIVRRVGWTMDAMGCTMGVRKRETECKCACFLGLLLILVLRSFDVINVDMVLKDVTE